MNGDTFLDLDFFGAESLWQRHKELILIGRKVDDTTRYGRLLIEKGRVAAFMEKGMPGKGVINAGCYVFPRSALDGFPPCKAFSLETDFLQPLAEEHPIRIFVSEGMFIDIGVPEDYSRAQSMFLSGLSGNSSLSTD